MKSNNIYQPRFAKRFFPLLIIVAGGTLMLTLYQVLPMDSTEGVRRGWFAFWTLAPALWFTMEYHWIYPNFKDPNANIEEFKHGQDVAAKFWAAVVVLLGALALDAPKAEPKENRAGTGSNCIIRDKDGSPSPAPAPKP